MVIALPLSLPKLEQHELVRERELEKILALLPLKYMQQAELSAKAL